MTKRAALRKLAIARKNDRLPPHRCFGDFHDGAYDRQDYVVPWTISAHNYDSDVMIIGQDWNSEANLAGPFDPDQQQFGQKPDLPTNRNLRRLLLEHLGMRFEQTYATDLFVFAKPGNMDSRISRAHLAYCAETYCRPQIDIVNPLVVICLGSATYNTLRRAEGLPRLTLTEALKERFPYRNSEIFAVTHTGGRTFNAAGGFEGVRLQWERIANRLQVLRNGV
ncbi:hypothetical protein LGH82_18955 [Mesorhizobium sp. PAMC28654]|uniref:uracil-DNA glycosylase family protein n=1 Tax=Mesorhizobium sp. PAMC28654 TaxID=2880934 RepID=UPI001D0A013F|nr:hypothetical protein LGH82_18955 [Mesorhizobium sp. PAMC28654]